MRPGVHSGSARGATIPAAAKPETPDFNLPALLSASGEIAALIEGKNQAIVSYYAGLSFDQKTALRNGSYDCRLARLSAEHGFFLALAQLVSSDAKVSKSFRQVVQHRAAAALAADAKDAPAALPNIMPTSRYLETIRKDEAFRAALPSRLTQLAEEINRGDFI